MLAQMKAEWDRWTRLTPVNSLYDRTLIWLFILLLVIGFIAVSSASIPEGVRRFGDPFHYAIRDALYIGVSLCACVFFAQFPTRFWEKYNVHILFVTFVLQILVLVVGRDINGAARWINIGPINFQPAELAKFAIICYFSSFYVRKFGEIRLDAASSIRPIIVFLPFAAAIGIGQSDLGSTAVIFVLVFAMLFVVGARLVQFVVLGLGALALFGVLVMSFEYRIKRLKTFLDPFEHYYGDGYQLAQSQMAFGQGELFGRGLGNSIQKLEYLPEAHTDFVMGVVGEEFGLFGITIVVLLLCALTFRAIKISREALLLEERFRGFFAFGIAIWIFFQGFVNLGVATGLLPTKGLTFPLISYGGSSLVIMSMAISVLVRIDYENRLARIGQAHAKED